MICSRKWSCAIWRRWNGGSCLIQSLICHREKFMCLSQSYKAVFDMNFPIPWITSVVVLCNASRFLGSCPREQGHEGWTSSTLLYAKALLRQSTWAGQACGKGWSHIMAQPHRTDALEKAWFHVVASRFPDCTGHIRLWQLVWWTVLVTFGRAGFMLVHWNITSGNNHRKDCPWATGSAVPQAYQQFAISCLWIIEVPLQWQRLPGSWATLVRAKGPDYHPLCSIQEVSFVMLCPRWRSLVQKR